MNIFEINHIKWEHMDNYDRLNALKNEFCCYERNEFDIFLNEIGFIPFMCHYVKHDPPERCEIRKIRRVLKEFWDDYFTYWKECK